MHAAAAVADRSEQVPVEWEREQAELARRLVTHDDLVWRDAQGGLALRRVAGVDISFVKDSDTIACAGLVVVDVASNTIVYEEHRMVTLKEPYVPGFLAFREVEFLVSLLQTLRASQPELFPECVMVDGNGELHPRGFGLACHLGVLLDLPTIGIGKTLFHVDGLDNASMRESFAAKCTRAGDWLPLVGESGRRWGAALKPRDNVSKPVFVSVGNKLSLESSVAIVISMSRYRLPEPIRFADQRSRDFLRKQGFNAAE